MAEYQQLVASIRDSSAVGGTDDARAATDAVLRTVGHCLTDGERRQLAERLPDTLDESVLVPGQKEVRDGTALLIEIAERLDTTTERARYLSQAVFGGFRDVDPGVVDFLRERLGSDLLDVVAPDGESPERAASDRTDVPAEFSDEEVTSALRRLPGWSGDHRAISRTVGLPADRAEELVERVQDEAARFNDRAEVRREREGVTFVLRTASGDRAAVTEADVRLAERIDSVVAAVGGGSSG